MKNSLMTKNAFTLVEIMAVIIIIGTLAALAVPRYLKTVDQAYERDAVGQLLSLYAASQLYKAQTGAYLAAPGGLSTANTNAQLDTNLINNGGIFEYSAPAGGASFYCEAIRTGGAFRLRITNDPIETGVNPCCFSGSCPTLPAC